MATAANDPTKVPKILLVTGGPVAVVFVASGCLMVLEIVAGRMIAGFLGASLYTWTSVIGVVLAGISVGNHAGGRLSDRVAPERVIGGLLLASAVVCAATLGFASWVRDADLFDGVVWPVRIGLSVTTIFFIPSCVLGTISPVVMTAALRLNQRHGRTVGALSAAGAAGSVAGTFLAGFVLLGHYGTTAIVWGVSGTLALLSLLFLQKASAQLAGAIATGLGIAASISTAQGDGWVIGWSEGPDGALKEVPLRYEKDSDYFHILVTPAKRFYPKSGLAQAHPDAHVLLLDAMVHGIEIPGRPEVLIYTYERITGLLTQAVAEDRPSALRTLSIGGGAYTFPRYLEATYPADTVIDVVEIDPAVTEAIHAAMGLPRSTRIRSYNQDARMFVRKHLDRRRYDVIYGDAFDGLSVPAHLTTVEFVQDLERILGPGGAYIMNVVDSPKELRLIGAIYNTVRQVFDHVEIYSVDGEHERQTFVLYASDEKRDLSKVDAWVVRGSGATKLHAETLASLPEAAGGLVLTDEFAPVDRLIAPIYAKRTEH